MKNQKDQNASELEKLERARHGDTEALEYFFTKYQPVIYWKSTQYFLQGAERDDLIQEAMIGFFKAIRDFDPAREASFRSFAEICINRQLLSAVKRSTRKKNFALNHSVSLDTPMADDESLDWTLLDVISEESAETPEDFLIKNEDLGQVARKLEKVTSSFEKEVLRQYLEGKSYQEMAAAFGKNEKAIDNALQRVKKKMAKELADPS
ncbi:RNA polymerase factor sigma-70 [Listeria ilorinensis]|uniref:RNA polymerase factor sigma-70 n=1 Tax=Listeria ilorinensis TaxID=2867439 RepID=UPI001EF4D167|nr:RNA polymerase factor sigma-70 [Listeria ilorinensis]